MAVATRPIRTTNKGLITERHGLVFPPDASVDELNCELEVNQIRRRRKGIQYENDFELSTFTHTEGQVIAEANWENVGGTSTLEYLVVQSGAMLYFYDKSSTPTSAGLKSFSVNLLDFDAANGEDLADNPFQGASLDGVFVVAHPGCELFYISYDSGSDTITTTQIDPQTRDFDWQGDPDTYLANEDTATVSIQREYDTKNAGWDDDAITGITVFPLATYTAARSEYPALTKSWFSGKTSTGVFNATEWDKVWSGTSLSGNGHYILDFFNKNREQYVAGLGVEKETARFRSVAAFSGRFWYAGVNSDENSGTILFTKTITSPSDYERCYQIHDPTAEDISDLLDTDGGAIIIQEAYGIQKLYPFGQSMLVFAENGVWQIGGVDGVFKATEYTVSRVTSFGILNPQTFVDAGGVPFWWSKIGIHTFSRNEVNSSAEEQNISRTTIQTFWNAIDPLKRLQAKATYDEENQKIMWIYPSNTETVDYKYNKALILDIVNQAFVPWEFKDQTTNTNYIVGLIYFQSYGAVENTQTVTENGVVVTVNGESVTWTGSTEISSSDSQVKFVVRDGATGKLTIALVGSNTFLDWGEVDYSSFFELGYDDFESPAIEKTPVSLVTYLQRTEDGWEDLGTGTFAPTNASACNVQAFWDFRTTTPITQSCYRLTRLPVPDESALTTFDYPTTVIINRTKIKGGGRVLNLKFTSDTGKDFQFMGYEVIVDRHEAL